MEQLCSKSTLWQKIRETLQSMGCIGTSMTLHCQNHTDNILRVCTAKDFEKWPEGGCLLPCSFNFPECGHPCIRLCHIKGMDHRQAKCRNLCLKRQCENDEHLCPKQCFEECGPCLRKVIKSLPCGHTTLAYCHLKPEEIKCTIEVEREHPLCLHKSKMFCYEDPISHKCSYDCDTRLDCGHKCRKWCHITDDPYHEEYKCYQPCSKLNKGCSQNHECIKKCYQECGNCFALVDKKLPCGHICKYVNCFKKPEDVKCIKACEKYLDCSHKCPKLCSEPCGECKVIVRKIVPECQHTVAVSNSFL